MRMPIVDCPARFGGPAPLPCDLSSLLPPPTCSVRLLLDPTRRPLLPASSSPPLPFTRGEASHTILDLAPTTKRPTPAPECPRWPASTHIPLFLFDRYVVDLAHRAALGYSAVGTNRLPTAWHPPICHPDPSPAYWVGLLFIITLHPYPPTCLPLLAWTSRFARPRTYKPHLRVLFHPPAQDKRRQWSCTQPRAPCRLLRLLRPSLTPQDSRTGASVAGHVPAPICSRYRPTVGQGGPPLARLAGLMPCQVRGPHHGTGLLDGAPAILLWVWL